MLKLENVLVMIFVIGYGRAEDDEWFNFTDTRRGGFRIPQFTLVMTPSPHRWMVFRMESVWAYFNKWSLYFDVKFMMEMIHADTERKHAQAKKYMDLYRDSEGLQLGLIGGQVRKHFRHMLQVYKKYSDPNIFQYGEYQGSKKNWFYFNHKSFYNDLTNFAKALNMVAGDYANIQMMHSRFYDAVERYKLALAKSKWRMREVRKTNTVPSFATTTRPDDKDDPEGSFNPAQTMVDYRGVRPDGRGPKRRSGSDYIIDYFGHKLYKRKPKSKIGPQPNPAQGEKRREVFPFTEQPVSVFIVMQQVADIAALRKKWLAKSASRPSKKTPRREGVQWPPPPGSDFSYKRGLRQEHFDKIRAGFDPKREGVHIDLDGLF